MDSNDRQKPVQARDGSQRKETMRKRRKTVWINPSPTSAHKQRAAQLDERGFDVRFMPDVATLRTDIAERRTSVVILSVENDEALLIRSIHELAAIRELQGARMVLVVAGEYSRALTIAAGANFRDIVPMDLDNQTWCRRITFAASGKSVPLVQAPAQITMSQICAVNLPARVSWISSERVCIESRVEPTTGSTVQIGGGLAAALGMGQITVIVEENRRNHLLYRFSDSFVARLSLPEEARTRLKLLLTNLLAADSQTGRSGPARKAFIAVQDLNLRQTVAARLDHPAFETSLALQKHAIASEPRFLSPDIVIIEESLCRDAFGLEFSTMMQSIGADVPIVVIGSGEAIPSLRSEWPKHRFYSLKDCPQDLADQLINRILGDKRPSRGLDPGAISVPAQHTISFSEVHFPARLQRLHPTAGQIALPVPVGNFALGRLDSPGLRRLTMKDPWFKVTSTWRDHRDIAVPFAHVAEFIFADTVADDRMAIADSLLVAMKDAMAKYSSGGHVELRQTGTSGAVASIATARSTQKRENLRMASGDATVQGSANLAQANLAQASLAVLPASIQANAPAHSTRSAPQISPGGRERGDFVSAMKPIIARSARETEHAVSVVRRLAAVSREKTFKQTLIFIAALAFIGAVVWVLYAATIDSAPDTGRVWSDSFKRFQEMEGGRR